MSTMGELSKLFDSQRVAVIGATERAGSVGAAITENLLDTFDGEVVPVNPNAESVFDLEAIDSISEATAIDLAIVTVPPPIVPDVIEDCGESDVRNVVVITAGFSEAGREGAIRERELKELARTYDLTLIGPNSLGVMSTPTGLNATFGPDNALPGEISLLSQSGALVTAVVDWANDQQIGFKDIVSLGNKAVIDETDVLRSWGNDPKTEVIIGYLEGIDDGRAFIETARDVTRETPIVLAKSGRTEAGAQAASSHTGALAGSELAYEAGLTKAGVIRAKSMQELFDAAQTLAGQSLPETEEVAIVTNAGGPGVIATDAIGDSLLSMASFDDETIERLRDGLPDGANIHNPVDILGDADAERFGDALAIIMKDTGVGALAVIAAPTAVLEYDELATQIVELQRNHTLPIAACLMGGERVHAPRNRLNNAGIPCYFDPSRAIASLDALGEYVGIRDTEWQKPDSFEVDRDRAREIIGTVEQREGNRLGVEAMGLLEAYGIPIPDSEIVNSADAAHRVATEMDDSVAMKIVSPDVVHKTDIGGVKVDVADDDVRDAYEEIVTRTRNYQSDATILGVQIQEMVDIDAGVETIVGMNRDPQFGPLLMFGLGGVFVEVLEDTTFRVAPLSEREAREMTRDFRAAPLLRGARGRDAVDVDGVVAVIQRLSQLVMDFPAILELDINPLVALPEGVQAIDIRLTIDSEEL